MSYDTPKTVIRVLGALVPSAVFCRCKEGRDDMQSQAQANTDNRWQSSFWSLIVTQFQGAFSDNVFKNLVLFGVLAMGFSEVHRQNLAFWIGMLFSWPFILFSMAGGYLADKYSKRSVTI